MQIMNKQFTEIKTKYSNKCQELQRLHLEYATLIKEIENKTDSSDEQCELIKTYKYAFIMRIFNFKILNTCKFFQEAFR